MDMLEVLNSVIDYIEEHLLEDLNISMISKVVGYSENDLQKMFFMITNVSIVEYVRRRRLTLAAQELQMTKKTVLDIALKYGYKSPDSFTRAFKQIHGINPSVVKKGGCILKSYGKISFIFTIKGVNALNYKIEEKEEFRVIGIKKWFSTENNQQLTEIPKMWDNLSTDTINLIAGLSNHNGSVGLCADMYNGGFDYWIGCISDKMCPNDLEEIIIPASTWAIFEVYGPMRPLPNPLQDVFQRIYSEWLPNSEYIHSNIPEIEYYSSGDNSATDYKTEIWIPIKSK